MLPQWIIEAKRDGHALPPDQIRKFVLDFAQGRIPDYQMAAFAMAVYFKGMTLEETAALTQAMLDSGDRLDLHTLTPPRVDKHSTGGIGDKISLALAPLAAACGLAVPMISGRGLGLTGGTLDKMESIPGYRTDLAPAEFARIVETCGCSIMGQTPHLCPADRKLYALRDVTGTVPSIPLITSSILSKKLAESLNGLVLDVKCGHGAFMTDRNSARALASSLRDVGRLLGLPVSGWITAMDQPLGRSAGNRVEVAEAVRILQNEGPKDTRALTLALTARMLRLGGLVPTDAEAYPLMEKALRSGAAFRSFLKMVRLHGGDPAFLENPDSIEGHASLKIPILSTKSGWIAAVNAEAIGRAVLLLGAGRAKVEDPVDPNAGISHLKKIGERVEKGEPFAELHASHAKRIQAATPWMERAFHITESQPESPPLLLEDLDSLGT